MIDDIMILVSLMCMCVMQSGGIFPGPVLLMISVSVNGEFRTSTTQRLNC